jgi:glucoamylase
MEKSANGSGMFPEQTWDTADIPERELFFGQPAGSAMPLVWAHAEYIKLCRSVADGRVFDTPSHTIQRYVSQRTASRFASWRFNLKRRRLPQGKQLRIEVLAPARVHWSDDGWRTVTDTPTRDTGTGVHVADLPTERLGLNDAVVFTLHWTDDDRWEGVDYTLTVE